MRTSLFVGALLVPLLCASCKGTTVVVPAKECPDPCCGGNAQAVDCAFDPNIQCMEDADVCSAHVYGCADGSYFFREPTDLPTTCAGDDAAADDASLVFGDVTFVSPEDAGDSSEADASAE